MSLSNIKWDFHFYWIVNAEKTESSPAIVTGRSWAGTDGIDYRVDRFEGKNGWEYHVWSKGRMLYKFKAKSWREANMIGMEYCQDLEKLLILSRRYSSTWIIELAEEMHDREDWDQPQYNLIEHIICHPKRKIIREDYEALPEEKKPQYSRWIKVPATVISRGILEGDGFVYNEVCGPHYHHSSDLLPGSFYLNNGEVTYEIECGHAECVIWKGTTLFDLNRFIEGIIGNTLESHIQNQKHEKRK